MAPDSIRPLAAPRAPARRHPLCAAQGLLCSATVLLTTLSHAQDAPAPAPQSVEIIGTSPLPGQGVSRDALPYTTQVVRRGALEQAQADTLTDHMARRLAGVQVNDIQGSPFQGDLTFRGYRASGLLGASQGLSVYLDGVRINEAFGDVVNWDMVPEFALESLSLIPGANPAFGLNTLGGAIALTTASGRQAPGLRAEASLGSFGRQRLDLAHGGLHEGGWHHRVTIGGFKEDGWRDHSDGHSALLHAKLGGPLGAGELSLSLMAGRSTLVGNGLVPQVTLADDGGTTPDLGSARRSAVYTHPDQTRNRVGQLSLAWRQDLGDALTLEALAHLRQARRSTVNGDEADEADAQANASFNRSATRQRGGGLTLALSGHHGAHQWQTGASVDGAQVGYQQTEQAGVFDATRGVLPLDEPAELSARVDGSSRSLALYATDTWRVAPRTHLTGTLRLNQARVSNQLDTRDDDTGVFESRARETFSYRSLNPALGLAHQIDGGPTVFANVARNNRVPTVIELGCADPQEPCRLPAGLQADPYLKQVVSRTAELGLRFGHGTGLRGSVTLYRTDNRDDILFRSVSTTGQLGYFQNFARTRHQGLDAELSQQLGPLEWSAAYSRLDATYQAHGLLRQGERNVRITPGTRLAGLPRQMLKLGADWRVGSGWSLGLDLQALGSRSVAGNEDGRLEDDADTSVRLKLPGYALVNLRAAWQPVSLPGVTWFARVSNLFDRESASFGALAETQFNAAGQYTGGDTAALFVAPGAPRAFTVGARLRF